MRNKVLGLPVDILTREESIGKIMDWLKVDSAKPKLVVTAYSEFFVAGQTDKAFADILKKTDLVTPDGGSVLAAVKYSERARKGDLVKNLGEGLKVGGEILAGKVGQSVTGVFLFEELTKMAAEMNWKVFLLGGWGETSSQTAKTLLKRFPNLRVAYDAGETRVGTEPEVDKMVVKKINAFKPDLLFVAYNPIKQEKWLASHLSELKIKVGMGVGGTFNEYLGIFPKAPDWMGKMGLKWLWRLFIEPKRIGRIWKAVVVFPWLVFRESL